MEINKNFKISLILTFGLICLIGTLATCDYNYASDSETFEAEVIKLVNIERSKHSLNPLEIDPNLVESAKIRANDITILFEHSRPDGSVINTLSPKIYGENIAAGQSSPKEVVSMWMNSEGHKKNILNSNFTTIGVGYKYLNTDSKKYNHYWVQLFGFDSPSSPSIQKIKTLKSSNIQSNQITLNWKSHNSDNFSGYKLYRYNTKTKKYKLIKTIINGKNKFTNKDLKSGFTYYYKILPFKSYNGLKIYGNFSQIIKINTRPAKPNFSLKAGNNKIYLEWKKVPRVSGYQIFSSINKNGKYTLQKTIKKAFIKKFTKKPLKERTYYFKLRSYKIISGKRIYSFLTSAKKIKPR